MPTKYIYNLSLLLPGDIILTRDHNDPLSNRVMEATNSEFSHAMLYVGGSSFIDAENRVEAQNLQRCLFDSPLDTCVLRIKSEFISPQMIDRAIMYARSVVGNPYSLRDAIRLEKGHTEGATENSQICTRLVAKAYDYSGLKIVDNVEMCTPQQLLESKYVTVQRNFLKKATDDDLEFITTHNVIDDMIAATEKLFDSLQKYNDGKICDMDALFKYVLENPEDDENIARLLKESGYLNVYKKDEEFNKYNYEVNAFIKYYGENAYNGAIKSLQINQDGIGRYQQQYHVIKELYEKNGSKSLFLKLMTDLYEQIVFQYKKRIMICIEVINFFENSIDC